MPPPLDTPLHVDYYDEQIINDKDGLYVTANSTILQKL